MPRVNKTGGLKADIYNLKGETVGKAVLPGEIFAAKANPQLLAQAVRVYQNNNRLGTHATKTRGEVAGSTRKIYRQKGTGRARHGSITAPIFIGGGVAHGPHPKDYSQDLPKKMKKIALFGALTDKFQSKTLIVVRGLEKLDAKTKLLNEVLLNLKFDDPKSKKSNTLLVIPKTLENIWRSGKNIPNLSVGEARLINAYGVLSHKNIIIAEDSIPILSKQFLGRKGV